MCLRPPAELQAAATLRLLTGTLKITDKVFLSKLHSVKLHFVVVVLQVECATIAESAFVRPSGVGLYSDIFK